MISTSHTAAPKPPALIAPAADVTGQWDWVCCDGKFQGVMVLKLDGGNKISGTIHDGGDLIGGKIEGSISGNSVQFTRTWNEDYRQDYKLTLSADGKKLTGDFDGTRDETVGNHFEATRK